MVCRLKASEKYLNPCLDMLIAVYLQYHRRITRHNSFTPSSYSVQFDLRRCSSLWLLYVCPFWFATDKTGVVPDPSYSEKIHTKATLHCLPLVHSLLFWFFHSCWTPEIETREIRLLVYSFASTVVTSLYCLDIVHNLTEIQNICVWSQMGLCR